jgi:hypothetical protein
MHIRFLLSALAGPAKSGPGKVLNRTDNANKWTQENDKFLRLSERTTGISAALVIAAD